MKLPTDDQQTGAMRPDTGSPHPATWSLEERWRRAGRALQDRTATLRRSGLNQAQIERDSTVRRLLVTARNLRGRLNAHD